MMKRLFLIILFFVITSIASAEQIPMNCNETHSLCSADLDGQFDADFELERGESLVFVPDDGRLTMIYRTQHDDINRVWMCCGIQEEMGNVRDDIWARRFDIENLDQAVIGYYFIEQRNNQRIAQTDYMVWRGENAPPEPPKSEPLQGIILEHHIRSTALNEWRGLTVYYPPNHDPNQTYPALYATDGRSMIWFAPYIEYLIVSGQIEPMLLVGVHSGEYRAQEYLPGYDPARFTAHETFFTEEVRHWAETRLGASSNPEDRSVFGYSNGGVFASAMALRHPDIYSIAFPFSAGMNPLNTFTEESISPDLTMYFTAGTLEPSFYRNTKTVATRFADAGANVIWQPRIAGHDIVLWQEELPYAIAWAYGN